MNSSYFSTCFMTDKLSTRYNSPQSPPQSRIPHLITIDPPSFARLRASECLPTDTIACPMSADEWSGIEMLMESDLMDLRAVEEDLSDMDDDDLTTWAFADVESFADAELLLPGCTPERTRQDPRAWASGPSAHPSQKRRMDLPLFEICSPIKRKRLDDSQRPPGPGGEANASLPACPARIPQAARQATHEAASKCCPPPPLPSPPRAQLPQPVSPPPSADRARKNPTPTKQLTKQPMRTALSLRVDSEGTALRAAAVAASPRRAAPLFVPTLSLTLTRTLTLTFTRTRTRTRTLTFTLTVALALTLTLTLTHTLTLTRRSAYLFVPVALNRFAACPDPSPSPNPEPDPHLPGQHQAGCG